MNWDVKKNIIYWNILDKILWADNAVREQMNNNNKVLFGLLAAIKCLQLQIAFPYILLTFFLNHKYWLKGLILYDEILLIVKPQTVLQK